MNPTDIPPADVCAAVAKGWDTPHAIAGYLGALNTSAMSAALEELLDDMVRDGALTVDDGDGTRRFAVPFTETERHAIARTLLDFDGYDRPHRPGLPAGWMGLFVGRGWIRMGRLQPDGRKAWVPTAAGVAVREAWLPEHLRGQP
jgi:hypothetical protein